jgi:superoxide dismutase, Cu-Zn family
VHGRKLVPATAAVLLLAACADDDGIGAAQPDEVTRSPVVPVDASAELLDPEGSALGTATFTDQLNGVQVAVEVHGMTTGSHQLRLVDVGGCPPPDGSQQIGMLPVVQVTETGVGSLSTLVGSVDLQELLAGNGTALVVEAMTSDPAAGSASGTSGDPAPESRASGDPGSATACGVIGR